MHKHIFAVFKKSVLFLCKTVAVITGDVSKDGEERRCRNDGISQTISNSWEGRAITQAVSLRLPTAAAWVQSHVRSCGICSGQSGIGEDFLRVLRFPLPILIPTKCTIHIYHLGLVQ
jgi:hypothetical protein